SVPTTASASRHRPRIRKPVAKSQWTCSAGGCMVSLEVLQQPGQHDEIEEKPDRDHEQRRLDEQPPKALAARMQHRHAVGLHDRPDDSGKCRQGTERRDDACACGALYWYFEFGNELCVHDVLP